MSSEEAQRLEALMRLTRNLVDVGKLMEAGWIGFIMLIAGNGGLPKPEALRHAYMAGVCHVFRSVMGVLEEDAEPTAADLERMDRINVEVEAFEAELKKVYPLRPRGAPS